MYIASAAATSTSPQGLYKMPSCDAASWKETHCSFCNYLWNCHCEEEFFSAVFSRTPFFHLTDYNHEVISTASKGQHRGVRIRDLQVLQTTEFERVIVL